MIKALHISYFNFILFNIDVLEHQIYSNFNENLSKFKNIVFKTEKICTGIQTKLSPCEHILALKAVQLSETWWQ